MTELEGALRRIQSDLADSGARFALVGGLAISMRTEPRFTRDADLAVSVGADTEAERIVRELRTRGYRLEAIVEQEATARLATVRLALSGMPPQPIIDLLFASSGIEPEVVSDAEVLDALPGLRIAVARVGHLIALKVLSRDDGNRPQDLVDLRALLRVASPAEVARARSAVVLIQTRGYQRGRNLVADLAALVGLPDDRRA